MSLNHKKVRMGSLVQQLRSSAGNARAAAATARGLGDVATAKALDAVADDLDRRAAAIGQAAA